MKLTDIILYSVLGIIIVSLIVLIFGFGWWLSGLIGHAFFTSPAKIRATQWGLFALYIMLGYNRTINFKSNA